MQAVRPGRRRQPLVGTDQERQAADVGDGPQPPRRRQGVPAAPKGPIDQARAMGQQGGDPFRLGGADRIGDEDQRRQGANYGAARRAPDGELL